jgi:hypothetical protein
MRTERPPPCPAGSSAAAPHAECGGRPPGGGCPRKGSSPRASRTPAPPAPTSPPRSGAPARRHPPHIRPPLCALPNAKFGTETRWAESVSGADLPEDHFWSRVGWRTAQRAGFARSQLLGVPKVDQVKVAARAQQQVLGLEVAVHHPGQPVQHPQRQRHVRRVPAPPSFWQPPLPGPAPTHANACLNDAPCSSCTRHGASITTCFGCTGRRGHAPSHLRTRPKSSPPSSAGRISSCSASRLR